EELAAGRRDVLADASCAVVHAPVDEPGESDRRRSCALEVAEDVTRNPLARIEPSFALVILEIEPLEDAVEETIARRPDPHAPSPGLARERAARETKARLGVHRGAVDDERSAGEIVREEPALVAGLR